MHPRHLHPHRLPPLAYAVFLTALKDHLPGGAGGVPSASNLRLCPHVFWILGTHFSLLVACPAILASRCLHPCLDLFARFLLLNTWYSLPATRSSLRALLLRPLLPTSAYVHMSSRYSVVGTCFSLLVACPVSLSAASNLCSLLLSLYYFYSLLSTLYSLLSTTALLIYCSTFYYCSIDLLLSTLYCSLLYYFLLSTLYSLP